ncbi:MAG: hypothetical protein ACREMS_09220 [Gemmatimonadaceae bacterium]
MHAPLRGELVDHVGENAADHVALAHLLDRDSDAVQLRPTRARRRGCSRRVGVNESQDRQSGEH